jgi:alpha-1,3-rhamnosyl/mannosyltransferase
VSYRVPEDLSLSYVWLVGWLRRRLPRLVALDRNDLLFAPNYFLPPCFDLAKGHLVATVHDLSVRRVPETMLEETRRELTVRLEETLGRAVKILTDTETVRGELIEDEGVPGDCVHAVHLGPGPVVGCDAGESPPEGMPERFILHVGTLEPRKSVDTLLDAWEILRAAGREVPPLVLCGRFGWKSEGLRRRIEAASLAGWLYHFGYLANAEVAALYRAADLVVMPSLYEGFGLPLVEAMTMNVPLLVSDIPVLREVGGEAAAYAPPRQPELWAERLVELLSSPERLAELRRQGGERAGRFTWERAAEATVEVWRLAAADAGVGR